MKQRTEIESVLGGIELIDAPSYSEFITFSAVALGLTSCTVRWLEHGISRPGRSRARSAAQVA